MSRDEFTNNWDAINGYTLEEARKKKAAVDEAYGIGTSKTKWSPAEIVPDDSRKTGYKVVICTTVWVWTPTEMWGFFLFEKTNLI